MSDEMPVGPVLKDSDFDALVQGRLDDAALAGLRRQVQAVLDDPDASIDHDQVWARLEDRMKRALARAA